MAEEKVVLNLAPATLRGLNRKRSLSLDEYLSLGPRAQRFILGGPDGATNRASIDRALKERAETRKD